MYGDWRAQVLRRSTLWESEPFGSGRPSLGLKSFRIDTATTIIIIYSSSTLASVSYIIICTYMRTRVIFRPYKFLLF